MTANQIAYWNMQESKRSNQARELETNRSNLAQEDLERRKQSETHRANVMNEMFNRMKVDETKRSNLVNEGINKSRVDLGMMELRENTRHNVAVEGETYRSNLAKETETNRSNLAKETETNRSNIAKESETHRSNKANEAQRVNELVYQIDKTILEERGRNTRHAGDMAMKGFDIIGKNIGSLTKIPIKSGSIMDYVGSGLHVSNAN